MITNERQYKVTKAQVQKFRDALGQFSEIDLARQGIDPLIITAQRSSLEQQLADLESDLARYERLRSGKLRQLPVANITDLGAKLIEARIIQGLSQREVAERLGMKEQQVQRYEQDRYLTANLTRCAEVAKALGVDLHARLDVRAPTLFDSLVPQQEDGIPFDPAKLPIKEMKKRGWLDEAKRLYPHASRSDRDLAGAFIREASQDRQILALHKEHIRAGSKQDEHALLAWKARVLWKARRLDVAAHRRGALDITTVRRLAEISQRGDGPQQAVTLLRERGIAVVFEAHLPQTHLDGAALLLDDEVPVIGMTLRFNRLDSFWFVLLHECAHILLHADGLRDGFFDDERAPALATVEKEADEYARNALIPSEVWKGSLVRFTASSEQVIQFAKKNKVGVAVVAGRIRRERDDYSLFSDLVGQGEAKKLISDAGYWEQ
jgi:HTH-type transcriptional regulator/antitoxin HigA